MLQRMEREFPSDEGEELKPPGHYIEHRNERQNCVGNQDHHERDEDPPEIHDGVLTQNHENLLFVVLAGKVCAGRANGKGGERVSRGALGTDQFAIFLGVALAAAPGFFVFVFVFAFVRFARRCVHENGFCDFF